MYHDGNIWLFAWVFLIPSMFSVHQAILTNFDQYRWVKVEGPKVLLSVQKKLKKTPNNVNPISASVALI